MYQLVIVHYTEYAIVVAVATLLCLLSALIETIVVKVLLLSIRFMLDCLQACCHLIVTPILLLLSSSSSMYWACSHRLWWSYSWKLLWWFGSWSLRIILLKLTNVLTSSASRVLHLSSWWSTTLANLLTVILQRFLDHFDSIFVCLLLFIKLDLLFLHHTAWWKIQRSCLTMVKLLFARPFVISKRCTTTGHSLLYRWASCIISAVDLLTSHLDVYLLAHLSGCYCLTLITIDSLKCFKVTSVVIYHCHVSSRSTWLIIYCV